ncbi:MAG: NAD(P)-dependent oxidoreductase [Candidatus Omnitrophica bacterium]|nr:NAD(P)-dependent oxidoreductase [Candidatus Omnitrophota bacterium]
MNILVTGATGFIGKHLVEDLSTKNNKIYCFVRDIKKAIPLKKYGVEFLFGDVTDKASLEQIKDRNIDIVYHCSGLVESSNIEKLREVNVKGTVNICDMMLALGIKKMIYVSSVAVITGNPETPLTDDMPFCSSNIYGQSKLEAEEKVLEYRKKGLKIGIIRPCMIYGADEPHMLGKLVRFAKKRMLPIIGPGENKLHLAYVKNVTQAMIYMAEKECYEGSFLIADDSVLTVKEVFNIIAQGANAKEPVQLPLFITGFLTKIPFIGWKIKFMLKEREYSVERLKKAGFKWPYDQRQALEESCKVLAINR